MSIEGRRILKPQFGDQMHITLKKILERLNSPVQWEQEADVDVNVTNETLEVITSNLSTDAFARLRVSNPVTELEAKHTVPYSSQWSDLAADGGIVSYNAASAYAQLYLSASSASGQATHQTLRRAYYQPGKSQLVLVTFAIGDYPNNAPADSMAWEVGMGDSQSGVFFGGGNRLADVDGVWFIRRGYGFDTKVTRSNWNVDRLDGTGPSGKTLQVVSATQIFWADCEWLGVGTVRFGFIIDGEFVVCHKMHFANATSSAPYSASLNLPIRYHVKANNAFDSYGEFFMVAMCGSVISEGGIDKIGFPTTLRRITAMTANSAAVFPILGWRLNVANIPTSRNTIVELDSLSTAADTALYEVLLYVNPTLSGTAPTWTQRDAIEICETVTNATTITGGTPIWSMVVSGTNQASSLAADVQKEFRLGITADDVPHPLWLAVRRLSGAQVSFHATANLSVHV